MVTSKPQHRYCGRFAPSPTGPLHFGSLVSALASYLQAKSKNGIWRLRMEDLDPPREQPGAADHILRTLEHYGLYWDGPVVYQSQRYEHYEAALATLAFKEFSFPCSCTRKDLNTAMRRANTSVYPGTCRQVTPKIDQPHAIRLKVKKTLIHFNDQIHGKIHQALHKTVGDFVIKRADGFYAYQLAVVTDDAEQGITEVVRGSDLLDNTPRQIYLQQCLALPQPEYAHIPVATNAQQVKLSKQTFAPPLDEQTPNIALYNALQFLGQNPPAELAKIDLNSLWGWAVQHWDLSKIPKVHSKIAAPDVRKTNT